MAKGTLEASFQEQGANYSIETARHPTEDLVVRDRSRTGADTHSRDILRAVKQAADLSWVTQQPL